MVPKLSTKTGLIYAYTRPDDPSAQGYYWTAIDWRNGKTVWSQYAGSGLSFNNNYAGLAIGPDGTAYLGVIGGIVSPPRRGLSCGLCNRDPRVASGSATYPPSRPGRPMLAMQSGTPEYALSRGRERPQAASSIRRERSSTPAIRAAWVRTSCSAAAARPAGLGDGSSAAWPSAAAMASVS